MSRFDAYEGDFAETQMMQVVQKKAICLRIEYILPPVINHGVLEFSHEFDDFPISMTLCKGSPSHV